MSTMETTHQTTSATRWHVDQDDASAGFAVKTFWGLMTVHGRFDRFRGWYQTGPEGTTIELTIDADSLDTGHPTRDRHLRSEDFFHVSAHPQITFRSTRVRDAGVGRLQVEGGLEAAGTVVPLAFEATVRPVYGGIEIEATTTVDQRRFGMSTGLLGMIRPPATLHVKARLSPDAPVETRP
jgi:polyisoprenoid-binding protein YceI